MHELPVAILAQHEGPSQVRSRRASCSFGRRPFSGSCKKVVQMSGEPVVDGSTRSGALAGAPEETREYQARKYRKPPRVGGDDERFDEEKPLATRAVWCDSKNCVRRNVYGVTVYWRAQYSGRPVEEMPAYLGWAKRDAKRREYRARMYRKPPRVRSDDERFDEKQTLATRTVRCDFWGCRRKCRGVGKGYFLATGLPPVWKRKAKWEDGELDMTFYCQFHYEVVTGREAPESSARNQQGRRRYQGPSHSSKP